MAHSCLEHKVKKEEKIKKEMLNKKVRKKTPKNSASEDQDLDQTAK